MQDRKPLLPDEVLYYSSDDYAYLRGLAYRRESWRLQDPKWTHDHCTFCGVEISDQEGGEQVGYVDQYDNSWICVRCFAGLDPVYRWSREAAVSEACEDEFDFDEITQRFQAEASALRKKVEGLGPLGVIELWERGEIDQDDFDTVFWGLWCDRVDAAGGLAAFPLPVRHYFASRMLEWEVGNGGFAQAAFNVPEMFEPAAAGYDAFDLPRCAERIREGHRFLGVNERRVSRWRRIRSIGRLFRAFTRSPFRRLDAGLDEIGWWSEDVRLTYVRSNKASFADPDERPVS